MDIQQKRQKLDKLKEQIKDHSQKQKRLQRETELLEKKQKLKKVIEAGMIFDEVGILDDYDHDKIVKFLRSAKEIKNER